MGALKFNKIEVYEGVHQWHICDASGNTVGEMQKERPCRWHGNGVSGLVQDRDASWVWSVSVEGPNGDGVTIDIPDGSTAWDARRIIKAALGDRD